MLAFWYILAEKFNAQTGWARKIFHNKGLNDIYFSRTHWARPVKRHKISVELFHDLPRELFIKIPLNRPHKRKIKRETTYRAAQKWCIRNAFSVTLGSIVLQDFFTPY